MLKRVEISAVVIVMLAACALMLVGLGRAPLQDYDEATYAQVTHEMLQSHNWIVLTHTGEVFIDKPPLYFWAAAITSKLFGETEFGLRLPSALAGIGLVAVVLTLAYELSGSLGVGALAGAIVLTISPVAETARQVRVDAPVAFFIMLAAYAWVKAQKNQKWYLLFGATVGLAFMTKDVIALFAAVAALLWALWHLDFTFFKKRYFWWGVVIGLFIIVPWHLAMSMLFGATFWQLYVGYDVFARTSQDLFAIHITNRDYVWYLANFAAPWAQVFVVALAALWIWWQRFNTTIRTSALWAASVAAVILIVFFYSSTKAPTYLIPLYPFAAIVIALLASGAAGRGFERDGARTSAIFLAKKIVYLKAALLAALIILGGFLTIYNVFHFNPYYAQGDELAREEKTIGHAMQRSPAEFYAFQTTTLGSVMYYSDLTHPLAFNGSAPAGSYLLLPTTARPALYELYSRLSTQLVWSGQELTLLRVLSED